MGQRNHNTFAIGFTNFDADETISHKLFIKLLKLKFWKTSLPLRIIDHYKASVNSSDIKDKTKCAYIDYASTNGLEV